MKCPKCRYLSFEPELRCKHCGYDFSLAEPAAALELIRPKPEPSAMFRRGASPVALASPRPVAAATVPSTGDLPLFIRGSAVPQAPVPAPAAEINLTEDVDVDVEVPVPAAPRPLAVRRRAPDSGRVGRVGPATVTSIAPAAVASTQADRDLLDYLRRVETEAAPAVLPVAGAPDEAVVPAGTRLAAAAVDALLLLSVNAVVFVLTLRQLDLGLDQIASVPVIPLASFLASLTVAYLLLFTVVSGQTVGKMIFRLRVIDSREDGVPATAKQMSCRELLALASVLLLGLGYLPALVGKGRALHDRLTHTRVVRT